MDYKQVLLKIIHTLQQADSIVEEHWINAIKLLIFSLFIYVKIWEK